MPNRIRLCSYPVVYNKAVVDTRVVACPDCDLLQRLPDLAPGDSARCPRCGGEQWRRREDSLDRTLAFALAAAVLCLVANTFPMLGLSAVGRHASTTLIGGAQQLWTDGREIVAGLVLLTAVLAPAMQIGGLLAIVLGARRSPAPAWVGTLLHYQPAARTWSMIEVMLIGVLVALIKIAELATVVPGIALYALGALVFLLAAMQASFDPREVWERIAWVDEAETSLEGAGQWPETRR